MALTTVTGPLKGPDGVVFPNARVEIVAVGDAMFSAVPGELTMPDTTVFAAADGTVTAQLVPGTYRVTVHTRRGKRSFTLAVAASDDPIGWLLDGPTVPQDPVDLAAEAAERLAEDTRIRNAAFGRIEVWVSSEAAGLAAVANGETFLVVLAGDKFDLHRRDSAVVSTKLRGNYNVDLWRDCPRLAPSTAVIIAAMALLGLTEVPVRLITGSDYDGTTDDVMAPIDAAEAALSGAGLTIGIPDGMRLRLETALTIADGGEFEIDLGRSPVTKVLDNTGVANAAIRNADNAVALDRFRLTGGVIREEDADTTGTLMRVHAKQIELTGLDAEFHGGIAVSLNGTEDGTMVITGNRIRSTETDEGSGDAAIRIGGGSNILHFGNVGDTDEDVFPFATNTSPGQDLENRDTTNVFFGPNICLTNGALFTCAASSNPSAANSTHTGQHANITAFGLRGECGSSMFKITFDNVADGVLSVDNVTIRDMKCVWRTPAPRAVGAKIVGWWYGTAGRLILDDVVMPDPSRPIGLLLDAPGADIQQSACKWTGGRHALREERPDDGIDRYHNCEFIATNANITLDDDEVDDDDIGGADRRDVFYIKNPNRPARTYVIQNSAGVAGQQYVIGNRTYTLRTSVSVANDVRIGATAVETAANLAAAINAGAGAGTAYGTGTAAHTQVTATPRASKPERVAIEAIAAGQAGNGIALTCPASATAKNATTVNGYAPVGRQKILFTGLNIFRGIYSPTISMAVAPMSGIYSAATNVDIVADDLEFWKSAGATGTWAMTLPAGCTVWIKGGLAGDVDNLGVTGGAAVRVGNSFATRAAMVAWFTHNTPAVGEVVTAAGLSYRYIGSGTAIADMAGWVPDGAVTPDHFATNTTPGTTAMQAAMQAAVNYLTGIGGGDLWLRDGVTYGVQEGAEASPFAPRTAALVLKPGVVLRGLGTIKRLGTDMSFDMVVGAGSGTFPNVTQTMGLCGPTIDGSADQRVDGGAGTGGNDDGFNLWLQKCKNPWAKDMRSRQAASWGLRIEQCIGGLNLGNIQTEHGADVNADGVHLVDCRDMTADGFDIYTEGDDGFIVEALNHDIENLHFTGINVRCPVGVVAAGRGVLVFRETLGGTLTTTRRMDNLRIEAVCENCGDAAGAGLVVTAFAAELTNSEFIIQSRGCTRGLYVQAGDGTLAGKVLNSRFVLLDSNATSTATQFQVGAAAGSEIDGNAIDVVQRNPADNADGVILRGDRWTGSIVVDYDPDGTKAAPQDAVNILSAQSTLTVVAQGADKNLLLLNGSSACTIVLGALRDAVTRDIEINGTAVDTVFVGGSVSGAVTGASTATRFIGTAGINNAVFVGDFGVGSTSLTLITDWNSITRPSGKSRTNSTSTTGTVPGGYSGFDLVGVLDESPIDSGSRMQRWESLGRQELWIRRYTSGAWGSWIGPFMTGTAVSSATDITAGRLLTVGYMGLGGQTADADANAADLPTRFFRGTTTASNLSADNYHILHMSRADDAQGAQIGVLDGGAAARSRMGWRHRSSGAPGTFAAWAEAQPILSGTTAQRPTTGLVAGLMYFDTTLVRPIWRNAAGSNWVDATGTVV